jgi:hypothetical protein
MGPAATALLRYILPPARPMRNRLRRYYRHGLSAGGLHQEATDGALEVAEDYKLFEPPSFQTTMLNRCRTRTSATAGKFVVAARRATTMEAGLLELQADHFRQVRRDCRINPVSQQFVMRH